MQLFYTAIDRMYYTVLFLCLYFFEKREYPFLTEEVFDDSYSEPDTEVYAEEVAEKDTFKTMRELLKTETHAAVDVTKHMVMYAGSISVPVYKNPTIEFDSQICTIPYGEMVMMLEPKGRFFKVSWNTYIGWVLRDELVDRAVRVYPEFVIGRENSVDDSNTAHVRAILGDVFSLGKSEFPLQAGEYVLYKLWKKGIRIAWPDIRPRVPGTWHRVLKGVSNVHIGVIPKVGSVMEYMIQNDIGHLAYVEAIFPDDTLIISEVNYPDSGTYSERELTKEEWKEMKPVFIRVV